MNPKYYTTTHVISDVITLGDANQTVKNIFGILKRGEDLNNLNEIPELFGSLYIQNTILTPNINSTVLNVINSKDDPLKRRPFIPVIETSGIDRYETPTSITYVAEWAGQVTSVDYESERYLIQTVYNNIFVEDLLSDSGLVYAGFISNNSIILTTGFDNVVTVDKETVKNNLSLTLQRKNQTIYLEYEYPYLMNGTINQNVYEWSNSNKLTSFLPITNIYLYDEHGKILSLTTLSEPIKKTIAQNLKVRVRYDI